MGEFESLSEMDSDRLTKLLSYAEQLANDELSATLDGSMADIEVIQQLIDDEVAQPETIEMQCIGLALGQVLVSDRDEFNWWIRDDGVNREVCIRYKESDITLMPQQVFAEAMEDNDGEVDVAMLYDTLVAELEQQCSEINEYLY